MINHWALCYPIETTPNELWISLIALMLQVLKWPKKMKSQTKAEKKTGHCQLTHEEFSHNKVAKWALARKGWRFKHSKEELVSELTT